MRVQEIASRLDDAQLKRESLESFEAHGVQLSVQESYEVQNELLARRIARGQQRVGFKLGFTSKSKMLQMGVNEVIVGQLTDQMTQIDGDTVDLGRFIQPKIEPEVAFLLGPDVDLADPAFDIRRAVVAMAPALEVIDSRYANYKFSHTDVIADNTSASGYVLGAWQPPADVANLGVRLVVGADNSLTQTVGSTAAILGDPWRSLNALVTMCRKYGLALSANHIVLAGAATEALPFDLDGVWAKCTIAGLGEVSLKGRK